MQNMKRILSVLVALSFITVAGVSTAAGSIFINTKTRDNSSMNNQVLIDLGLYDKDGNSQVEAELDIQNGILNWIVNKFVNLTAANLLTAENKAKSKESFNFLTSVLKLEVEGDGNWCVKTFDRLKTSAILLTVVLIEPVLKTVNGNYFIAGTVKVQWKNDKSSFGEYSIRLKSLVLNINWSFFSNVV